MVDSSSNRTRHKATRPARDCRLKNPTRPPTGRVAAADSARAESPVGGVESMGSSMGLGREQESRPKKPKGTSKRAPTDTVLNWSQLKMDTIMEDIHESIQSFSGGKPNMSSRKSNVLLMPTRNFLASAPERGKR